MTDELGAVRRTPRPTGDRQTPETGPSADASATITPSPVSGDHPGVREDGTDDLSPEVEAALIERHGPELQALAELAQQGMAAVASQVLAIYRSPASDALAIEREDGEFTCVERHPDGGWRGTGLIEVVPDDWVLARYQPGPECDMEAYAALPPCTACEGGGQDTHGTVFEAPLAVHFAGPPVEIAGRRRQLCMWCGHVLFDVPPTDSAPQPWPEATLVRIEDGLGTFAPHEPGTALPPGCCALPDDDQYSRTASSGPTAQGIPDKTESTVDGCICTENRCDYDDHDNPPTDWLCVPCGQLTEGTPCLALDGPADVPVDPGDGYPVDLCGKHTGNCSNRCLLPAHHDGECDDDPRPDEAQETRAADWPAEETDRG